MKDYSAMSDQQINTAVGLSFGEKVGEVVNGLQLMNIDAQYLCSSFDPCNDPADAWPIIIANKISLMFDASTEEGNEAEWCLASSPCDQIIVDYVTPDKMLRAAMIVYLKMMEQKS